VTELAEEQKALKQLGIENNEYTEETHASLQSKSNKFQNSIKSQIQTLNEDIVLQDRVKQQVKKKKNRKINKQKGEKERGKKRR